MNISLLHFHFPHENFNKEKCYPMSALSGKVLLVFCILFAPECPRARTLAGIYLALKQNFGFKVVCAGVSSREDTPAHTTTNAENSFGTKRNIDIMLIIVGEQACANLVPFEDTDG
ncbi:hypothetical protein M8J77_005976 [Diaphorina citri]|nr:hypothetical protein M8J77_005976 [Diaphorina citri]